jgi:hypothetical protein
MKPGEKARNNKRVETGFRNKYPEMEKLDRNSVKSIDPGIKEAGPA